MSSNQCMCYNYLLQMPLTLNSAISSNLSEKIIAAPDSPDVLKLEAEIDQMVYALYGLTPEEIAVVDGSKSNQDNMRLK